MKNNKLITGLLGLLLFLKFIYFPWGEWVDEASETNQRLKRVSEKQQFAISNEQKLMRAVSALEGSLDTFNKALPSLKNEQEVNLYWLNLASEIKNTDLKVYNQKVEFMSLVSESTGIVTGTLSISGAAHLVVDLILELEKKRPSLFIGEMKLSKSSSGEQLVAQMTIGHWYKSEGNAN